MTNEISKEVKDEAVLVFKDGSHKFISQQQHKAILGSINSDVRGFTIADTGEYFDYAMVSKVLTLSAFYEQYPEHRPHETPNNWADQRDALANQQIRKPTGKAKELMKKGFIDAQMNQLGYSKERAESNWERFIKNNESLSSKLIKAT